MPPAPPLSGEVPALPEVAPPPAPLAPFAEPPTTAEPEADTLDELAELGIPPLPAVGEVLLGSAGEAPSPQPLANTSENTQCPTRDAMVFMWRAEIDARRAPETVSRLARLA
jgi:hypothetical protein